jgi:23S rRNA pseudouridine1911/1915/1917 synthase
MMELPIIYEDADILVLNKPAGLPVLAERWDKDAQSLVALLQSKYPNIATAHRIDKDTSGLLLCVKHTEAARAMAEAFYNGKVQKLYLALLHGKLPQATVSCTLALRLDANRKHQTEVDPKHGLEARSDFRVIESWRSFSWVEVQIFTGRTHQIRAHAKAMGNPLVGDSLYGGQSLKLSAFKSKYRGDRETERPLINRPALHAATLSFCHPMSGEDLSFSVPLPKDLAVALQQLRLHGTH